MKKYEVVITPRAERHLAQIYSYIANHSSEERADNYVDKIIAACRALTIFPERGTRRDDLQTSLRTIGYAKSVTIAFSINAATHSVAIHGVFYGGQDFETLIGKAHSDD